MSLMQNDRVPGGGEGGVFPCGSMSGEVVSSEESSSFPDEPELELGLGLSLGGCGKANNKPPATVGASWDQYARILKTKDFSSLVSTKDSSSSSSFSSVAKAKNNGCCGTKRTAEPSSPSSRSGVSQVVGWPPIRNYRMNSLVNHSKAPLGEESTSTVDKWKSKNTNVNEINCSITRNNKIAIDTELPKTSLFVKVNMAGIPIGRKVDLNAQSCYEALSFTLNDMFRHGAAAGARSLNVEDQAVIAGTRRAMSLLNGTSDFVLIYEDKVGDWMLVGDIPWEMFLSSVRRLRIIKTAEANGLAPRSDGTHRKQMVTPV